MASILKGVSGGGFRWNNFLVITVLLLVVVGLFLIPEFVGWGKPSARSRVIAVEEEDELDILERRPVEDAGASPLAKLVQLINSGGAGELNRKQAERKGAELPQTQGDAISASRDADGLAQMLSGGGTVSWKELHSSTANQAMKNAQREALALAKRLGSDYPEARFALYNYSGGLSRVMQASEKSMTPADAVLYLDQLDKSVTEAMLRESVERSDFLRWAEVSLGPLSTGGAAMKAKKNRAPSFRPEVNLSFVKVVQPAAGYGRWDPESRAYVTGRGYVIGKDVRRVFLWRSDGVQKRLTLHNPDAKGRRLFRIPQSDARLLHGLIASDKSGAEFRKYYDFYGRARHFVWNRRNGRFGIPFAEHDPRLDMYFRVEMQDSRSSTGNLLSRGSDSSLQSF